MTEKIFDDVSKLAEFLKDFDKLAKKFRTLPEDLETFINVQLKAFHKLTIDNKGIFPISSLGIKYPKIYKAKKFTCKSLKGKGALSGIRIIYAYFDKEDRIEFIEIYYKGDKDSEDRVRILRHYKQSNSR